MASSSSVRLGVVLAGLTAVNIYVFVFKKDMAVTGLMEASSMKGSLDGEQPKPFREDEAIAPESDNASAPGTLGGTTKGEASNNGRVVEGEIGKLDTLSVLLAREGFESVALTVSTALASKVDPRSIKPGDKFILTFDAEGAPEVFEYRPNPVDAYIVTRGENGTWNARHEQRKLEIRKASAGGTIRSSLYGAVQDAGESPGLVSLLVDLFAWDINFYIDTHPGDHFKIVIEKQYLDGQFYRYGKLLAAEYGGKVGTFRAFHFKDGNRDGYFDDKGQSIAKSFLKTPLRFVRISSKFDPKRFHPVLHKTRAHQGVDYAAPRGTPVWAASDGKVVEAQMKRGSGNTIVIKHSNGYATRYYHLDKFAKGLSAGQNVKQKQVIGYVGTTGLSTGPHLHFGLTQNGNFVDPLKLKSWRESPVSKKAAFMAAIQPHLGAFERLKTQLASAGTPRPAAQ